MFARPWHIFNRRIGEHAKWYALTVGVCVSWRFTQRSRRRCWRFLLSCPQDYLRVLQRGTGKTRCWDIWPVFVIGRKQNRFTTLHVYVFDILGYIWQMWINQEHIFFCTIHHSMNGLYANILTFCSDSLMYVTFSSWLSLGFPHMVFVTSFMEEAVFITYLISITQAYDFVVVTAEGLQPSHQQCKPEHLISMSLLCKLLFPQYVLRIVWCLVCKHTTMHTYNAIQLWTLSSRAVSRGMISARHVHC